MIETEGRRLQRMPRVLTVAGSDPSGGAGIQADIKVITCLGGYAMSAVTALTAQNTRGVQGIHPVPSTFVRQQMALCISDVGVDAVKTGMLCNVHIVRAVARILGLYLVPHLVVDPVRKSTSGNRLLLADAEEVFIKRILPLAEVVTPNLREAGWLSGVDVADIEGMRRAAERILKLGPRAVLVKGGHLHGTPTDLLYDGNTFLELPGERLETKHTHGAGCSFSAALATELGAGVPLPDAARRAKRFVTEAIRHSIGVGHDRGPTNPLAGAGLRASRS